MIINNSAYKYKTPFKGPYEIVQKWTDTTVTFRMRTVTTRLNSRHIKPYNNQNIEQNILFIKQMYINTYNQQYMTLYKYIYTHIYTFLKAKIVLMTISFLFYTQNRSFRERFINILQWSKVL